MPSGIGPAQALLRREVDRVHHCLGRELQAALLFDEHLAEVRLAETVASLVQRHRLNVDIGDTVVCPREARIVIDLAKRNVALAVIV